MIDQSRRINPIFPAALLPQVMETARVENFCNGGREAMIALRALTLSTGRTGAARQILLSFAQQISHQMGSSCRADCSQDGSEGHTADGPLWYFEAVGQFLKYTGDYEFVQKHLYSVLSKIISWYVHGINNGIKVDGCGLVTLGKMGIPLTWMNAEIDGRSVTPRHGKPVEIQALWYNALCIMEDLAREFGDDPAAKRFAGRAAVARWSFNYLFWNAKKQCLYDVVHASTHDSSVRPNQVFAISLCHPILSEDRARCVLHVIQRELLTPFGLRTLAPDDPQYRGRCEGGPTERSRAYHQGSVWLWLISPFMEAYLKTYGFSDPAREQMAETLDFLDEHLGNWSAGQAEPEIFDGDFPHIARGNTSGGWSVAEVRRLRREIVSSGKMQGVVT